MWLAFQIANIFYSNKQYLSKLVEISEKAGGRIFDEGRIITKPEGWINHKAEYIAIVFPTHYAFLYESSPYGRINIVQDIKYLFSAVWKNGAVRCSIFSAVWIRPTGPVRFVQTRN